MVMHGGDSSAARLGAYLATAYSQYYPDVKLDDAIPPDERQIAAQLADSCQFDPKDIPTLQNLTKQLNGNPVIANPSAGAMGERLRQNAPNQRIDIPVLVVQGLTDDVVYPAINDTFVDQQCAAGQHLDYWHVPGRDHGGVVAPDSPITNPLIAWTKDRLAGKPQTGCNRVTVGVDANSVPEIRPGRLPATVAAAVSGSRRESHPSGRHRCRRPRPCRSRSGRTIVFSTSTSERTLRGHLI